MTDWVDDEPVPSEVVRRTTARLLRRSRASWPLWLGAVLAISASAIAKRIRFPPAPSAEVVVRMREGVVQTASKPLTTRGIRMGIFDLALSRANLLEVARRHRAAFPRLAQDPVLAAEDLLSLITVTVSENDFIEYRQPNDPPRSVRIAVSVTHPNGELALALAREVAELVMKPEFDRQRREIQQQATLSYEAQAEAQEALDNLVAEVRSNPYSVLDADRVDRLPGAGPASGLLGHAVKQDVTAQLMLRALEAKQAIHLEIIDPGHTPPRLTGWVAVQGILTTLPALVLAVAMLAGAFDPRILDGQDVRALGIPAIGHARLRRRV